MIVFSGTQRRRQRRFGVCGALRKSAGPRRSYLYPHNPIFAAPRGAALFYGAGMKKKRSLLVGLRQGYLLLRAPERLSFCMRRSDIFDSLRCMKARSLSSNWLSAVGS